MKLVSQQNVYRFLLVIDPHTTKENLRLLAVNYSHNLKQLGAETVSIFSHGKYELEYEIRESKVGYFVEMTFDLAPAALSLYQSRLQLDKNILRFMNLNVVNE